MTMDTQVPLDCLYLDKKGLWALAGGAERHSRGWDTGVWRSGLKLQLGRWYGKPLGR
jgi:hypothetical protein